MSTRGKFVQIVHVRNNHWCVVSTVGCDCGVIHVYDSLYRSVSRETLSLIASMVYSPSSELNITKMDVEKQSNGSDCGVLAIAYAFDICNGLNPCKLGLIKTRSGSTWPLVWRSARFHVSLCWVGEVVFPKNPAY